MVLQYVSHSLWPPKPTSCLEGLEFSLLSSNKTSTDINLLLLKSVVLTSVAVELDENLPLFKIPSWVKCSLFFKRRAGHTSENYFITELFISEGKKKKNPTHTTKQNMRLFTGKVGKK